MRLPGRLIEQAEQCHALLIVDRRDHVGVADVVNPGHVLVADAFDAMTAEAELVERRALQRFGRDDAQRCGWTVRRKSPAAIVPALPVAET